MNGRYKHLIGSNAIDVLEGQFWIRRPEVTKINNPLNIQIVAEPDAEDDRFYVKDVGQGKYLYFNREDIINKYDKKIYTGPLDLNEQIYEILGGRNFRDKDGNVLYGKRAKLSNTERIARDLLGMDTSLPKVEGEIPDYSSNPKLADMLLHGLEKYNPKIKVRMGKYTVYLDKPYDGVTREEAICKAWIDKNR